MKRMENAMVIINIRTQMQCGKQQDVCNVHIIRAAGIILLTYRVIIHAYSRSLHHRVTIICYLFFVCVPPKRRPFFIRLLWRLEIECFGAAKDPPWQFSHYQILNSTWRKSKKSIHRQHFFFVVKARTSCSTTHILILWLHPCSERSSVYEALYCLHYLMTCYHVH